MTTYVSEVVANISKKHMVAGLVTAGVLACGSVGAVNALSVGNSNTTDNTQRSSMTRSDGMVSGSLGADGSLQGSTMRMQGDNTGTGMQGGTTSTKSTAGVNAQGNLMAEDKTSAASDNNHDETGGQGSVNAAVNAGVSAEGQSTHDQGDNSTADTSSSSAGLNIDLGLGLQGEGTSSGSTTNNTNDGLLGGIVNL